ncbi:MAG TPA: trypsin-like peptidase domain-containing protein [Clostridia bacterium]|jgi:serine protease Do|nr:trypsin-like peptidase domain-containing protein [Clostridia bacterium]
MDEKKEIEKEFTKEELIDEGFSEKDFIEGVPEPEDFLEEWEEEEESSTSGWFMRTVALLIIVTFAVFSFPHISNYLTGKFNFLKENQELMEDEIVRQCRPAVVSVEAGNSRGTGFNISPEGTIITNEHVVSGAPKIIVRFEDGRIFHTDRYQVIAGADIAVLHINADTHDLPVVEIDRGNQVNKGETVTIIGNPLGFEKISQRGTVGRFHRIKDSPHLVFDIKVSINPGNSGSPVINSRAKVVGIVFASTMLGLEKSEEDEGQKPLALAFPVNVLPESVIKNNNK